MCGSIRDDQELREKLANLCHEQWSGWMEYLFSKCTCGGENGNECVIPKWAVDRWRRQLETKYNNLSEVEMESDRKEADKFLKLFDEH